ncbi:MAG: hypothetical protein ABIQ02_06990 [Saprospiraceae bacterium]
MRHPRAIVFLLLVFFGIFSPPAYAQFNLKTGYNFSIVSSPGINRIVSDFNTSQSFSKPFRELHWLHGFEGGVRYKRGFHAVELTYQGAGKSFRATGLEPGAASKYTDKIKYSIQSAAFGYQLGQGLFGFGTDLQYQWYKFAYKSGISDEELKNIQHMTAFKFYLILNVQGNEGIDFAFQPYLVLPSKYFDLEPVSEILDTESVVKREKWIRYGLTMVFYNGEK